MAEARTQATLAFYAYRILSRAYFHLPVLWVWFYAEQGLDIWVAAVLLAVYSGTLTFGAPLAQRLQRRLPGGRSLVVGELMKAAGLAVVVVARDQVPLIVLGQLLGGIGYSLGQGPDSVLLRSLYRDDEGAVYAGHESRSMSWVFVSVLIAGVIGGFMYEESPSSPFVASIVVTLLAAVAAVVLTSRAREPEVDTAPAGQAPAATVPLTADERRWTLYYATMRGFALAAFVAVLPMLFFLTLEVDVTLFGLVLGSFSVMAWFSGRYGVRLLKKVSDRIVSAASVVLLGAAFAILAVSEVLGVALVGMAVLGAVNGVVRPMAMSQLNAVPGRTKPERGRILAGMERRYGLVNATAIVAGGILADVWSDSVALWTFSAVAVLLGLGSLAFAGRGPFTPRGQGVTVPTGGQR